MKFPHLFAGLLFCLGSLFAAEPFLGPIPVQFVQPGTELTLDLRRFIQTNDPATIKISHGKFDPATFQFRLPIAASENGLRQITLEIGDHRTLIILAISGKTARTFTFRPAHPAQKVHLVGSFNDWSQDRTPLAGPDASGTWSVNLPLAPGTWIYKFYVDGQWLADPANPDQTPDGFGGVNSQVTIPTEVGPQIFADRLVDQSLVVRATSPLAATSVVAQLPDGSSRLLESTLNEKNLTVPLADLPPGTWVRVIASNERGQVGNVVRHLIEQPGAFQWQDGVMYYAFTDRFVNGSNANDAPVDHPKLLPPANFFGGDWAGIIQKIEAGYFEKIGVNTLWLAPLNRNPAGAYQEYPEPRRWFTGYHGYWPISPTEVDPRFGTAEELKKLVATAHARGIKVLADLVLHHVHTEHPWWKEHRDWFGTLELPDGRKNLRLWDEHQFTTWFEPYLPTFDFNNEKAVAALIDNAIWWAEEYQLDGFRLDAVKHIPQEFWWKFRAALREKIKRPLYLVGETFMDREGIRSFVGPNMLDGQFDFPLYDVIVDVIAKEQGDFRALEDALAASERVYGREALMSPLIGNHDKARFMAYADGDLPDPAFAKEEEIGWHKPPAVDRAESWKKIALAQAFLFAIDGVPMVYYGDEIGLTGAGDPDNRRFFPGIEKLTPEQAATFSHFQKLGQLRRSEPALRMGSRRPVLVERDLYAFTRVHLQSRVLCAFNRAFTPANATVEVGPDLPDGNYFDGLTEQTIKVENGSATLTLPARSAAFFTKK